MSKVIVRMWTKDGYHKDVAILDELQVRMTYGIDMDAKSIHIYNDPAAVRVVIDPKLFPEACEFEVLVK